MAIQVVRVRFDVDSADLERTEALVKGLENDLGMAEKEASQLTKEFSKQAKSIDQLVKEERELVKQRNKSTDPKEVKRLNSEIKKTRTEVKRLKGEFQKTGNQGAKSFNKMGGALSALGPAIAAAFSVQLIKDFVTATIDAAARFEQTQVAFTTLLGGSSEAANKLIGDLERLSLATPLTPESLNEAAKTLLSFGIAQDKILPTLQRLGDVAQGDSQKLQQLSLVFGQISSAGRLMGQDLLQLINVGFNPLQIISEQTGRAMIDLKKDMEKGLISFDMVEDAFKSATEEGGLFFGAMEAQSTTFSGRVSTLEGNMDALKRQIGNELLPIAGQFVELLLAMTKNADRLGEEFSVLSSFMDGILGILKLLTEQEEENAVATEALRTVIKNIFFPIQSAIDAFQNLERDLKKVSAATDEVFVAVNNLFGLDIATPFKDAADAAKALELRQRKSAAETEFLAQTMDRFKEVTGATDSEVAAFRKQFKGFSTEGLTASQAIEKLGIEFGKFLKKSRKAEKEVPVNPIKDLDKAVKELNVDLMETYDGLGFLGEEAMKTQFNALSELPERVGMAYDEWLLYASETAEEIANLNKYSVAEDVAIFRQGQVEKLSIAGEFINSIFSLRQAAEQAELTRQTQAIERQRQSQLSNQNLTEEQKFQINEKFDKKLEQLEREAFERQKRFSRTQAIINGALAVTKILAEVPKADFGIATAFLIAGAIATTAAQVATIDSQQFKEGGYTGDGPANSVSKKLGDRGYTYHKGEFVFPKTITNVARPAFESILAGNFDPEKLNDIVLGRNESGNLGMVFNNSFSSAANIELLNEMKSVNETLKGIKQKPQFILNGKEFTKVLNKKIGKNIYIRQGL